MPKGEKASAEMGAAKIQAKCTELNALAGELIETIRRPNAGKLSWLDDPDLFPTELRRLCDEVGKLNAQLSPSDRLLTDYEKEMRKYLNIDVFALASIPEAKEALIGAAAEIGVLDKLQGRLESISIMRDDF